MVRDTKLECTEVQTHFAHKFIKACLIRVCQAGSGGSFDDQRIVTQDELIQFMGRNTLIILRNDNGTCPPLAICITRFEALYMI
ncbi:hypothetical protein L1987_29871 [Smallanthus sonchifolius]|uniref:Uncharacterized protein n=1 Tax=Smallanthus sonchifolius TaxID=185202 RepID=A0ACB9I137_9ASTR|nr:hypothetical protein L1987_29871 [Smallanthus sonchifolius]